MLRHQSSDEISAILTDWNGSIWQFTATMTVCTRFQKQAPDIKTPSDQRHNRTKLFTLTLSRWRIVGVWSISRQSVWASAGSGSYGLLSMSCDLSVKRETTAVRVSLYCDMNCSVFPVLYTWINDLIIPHSAWFLFVQWSGDFQQDRRQRSPGTD